jgi:hypothetical protein
MWSEVAPHQQENLSPQVAGRDFVVIEDLSAVRRIFGKEKQWRQGERETKLTY